MPMPRLLCALALSSAMLPSAFSAIVWNEATQGDLSSVGSGPTFVAVAAGSNQIVGTTGNPGPGIDRDYFFISVPTGMQLTALTVLPGTSPLGLAFFGVQAGSQVSVSPTSGTAAGLLGWTHYASADINTDILPRIGSGAGATGFSGPLAPGNYAFWVQDFNAGSSSYGFDLTIAAVPEPAAALTLAAGLAVLGWTRRRR